MSWRATFPLRASGSWVDEIVIQVGDTRVALPVAAADDAYERAIPEALA